MNILKIIHGYPPRYNAGSEVYSQSICNELKKRHRVFVFTREENNYLPDHQIRKEERDGICFYTVNKARDKDGYLHPDLDRQFGCLLKEIQVDIAHIGHLNHLSTGLVKELKKAEVPIVFTLHDFWLMCPRGQFLQVNFGAPDFHRSCSGQEDQKCAIQCYNRYFSGQAAHHRKELDYWTQWIGNRMRETRNIINEVDLFIAPSRYLSNRFIQDFEMREDKIIYLDYGFPLQYLSPVESKEKKPFTFGYIGTHIPAKGIDLLINAFAQLKEKASLKIWGRPNGQHTEWLKTLAQQCTNPVEFMGEYANMDLMQKVFSAVDAIVVPSIWGENSPLVIHEAQACHIPVITADFGGMAEYVQHRVNGLLFKHREEKDLAQQMHYAITHPTEMKQLGQNAYLYDREGRVPDIQEHCKVLENIYQKLINGKK